MFPITHHTLLRFHDEQNCLFTEQNSERRVISGVYIITECEFISELDYHFLSKPLHCKEAVVMLLLCIEDSSLQFWFYRDEYISSNSFSNFLEFCWRRW